jgi:hypothetical protein
MVNIEVKTPKTVTLRPNYDSDRLIRVLYDCLQIRYNSGKYQDNDLLRATNFSFISSFDHDFIKRYQNYED